MVKTSQSQLEANKKWADKNRERKRYTAARSSARSFIRTKATEEDLAELEKIIEDRKKYLKNFAKSLDIL